jgi:hypothetical protein
MSGLKKQEKPPIAEKIATGWLEIEAPIALRHTLSNALLIWNFVPIIQRHLGFVNTFF